MKKEVKVKTHTRRTKSGKTVTVRAHTAKHEIATKENSGREFRERLHREDIPFTLNDYKQWYHWDQENDPDNEVALRVEKMLIRQMGKRKYNKYFDELTEGYSPRGHIKMYRELVPAKTETTPKPKQERRRRNNIDEGVYNANLRKTLGESIRKENYTPVGLRKAYELGDESLIRIFENGLSAYMQGLRAKHSPIEFSDMVENSVKVSKTRMTELRRMLKSGHISESLGNSEMKAHQFILRECNKLRKNNFTPEKLPSDEIGNVPIESYYRGKRRTFTFPTVIRQPAGVSSQGRHPERFIAFDTAHGKIYVADSEKEATNFLRSVGISKDYITYLGVK